MADRNEVFRIILEGRDRLSGQLKGVRNEINELDKALNRLKRNKTDDFPLFGGGKATRGPGGQFIKKEEISFVDQMRQRVDQLNNSLAILKRNKAQEFPLFGGGRAVRGDDGRFIRVQDVTLLEKAKNRLDAIDKALVRIRTRIRRGPLVEGEEAGAGGTRLVRNQLGQFVRAQDISLVQRLGRELNVVRGGLRSINDEFSRAARIEGGNIFRGMANGVQKLDSALGRLITKLRPGNIPGFGGTTIRQGPGGQFVKVEDISLLNSAREKLDALTNAFRKFRTLRLGPVERAIFGGASAQQGEGGRFIRVEQVSLIERARLGIDRLGNSLQRLKTRVIRGPLIEGETAGAGGTRLVRGAAGQFTRADDLTLLQRIGRELRSVNSVVRNLRNDTRTGILTGVRASIDDVRRLGNTLDSIKDKIKTSLTGRFISVADTTAFGRFISSVESGFNRIKKKNQEVMQGQRETLNEIRSSFRAGFDIAKQTQEQIDKQVFNSREAVKAERIALRERQELEKVALSEAEDIRREALIKELEDAREVDRLKIRENRKAIAKAKADGDIARKEELEDEIAGIQRARRERERIRSAEQSREFQTLRADQRIKFSQESRAITNPDVDVIEKAAIEARTKAINEAETALGRMGRRAGLAFGDVVRGAKSARSGLRDMDRDIRLVNNAFTRFGFAVGQVFRHFDQLVNLRWLFLTGILTIFFTLITQIGTALVALAASAIQAGAALGGAFVAGIAQALPVIGLLTAAFSRFNVVLDAVKLNEKLGAKAKDNVDQIKQAAQRLADAQYSLKKAVEAVGDAQYAVIQANKDLKQSYKDVRDATKDLADAKIQAARDIVDANLEEKDAALSLQEAELGVLDAKKKLREEEEKQRKGVGDREEARAALREAQQRLKIAREQGDASEISAAQQQVTLAEQNLNAILDQVDSSKNDLKDAELGVKRANLTVEQARVRNNRARVDAKKAREEGVQGSDTVKSAQDQLKKAIEGVTNAQHGVLLANRNVKDALHQVAVAHREVADARKEESDARKGQTQADKDAQKAFADLSPAEKKLFNSLKRLRKVFKDVFVGNSERDGILGPITEAIARFADTLTKLLLDPQIQKAAKNLALAIADAFDSFRKFVGSAEFKEALLFFTKEAADNIPRIVEGMLNLAHSFLDIAKAATPIFDRLLGGAVGLTERLRQATSQQGEVRRPEEGRAGRQGAIATLNQSGLDRFLASGEKHLDAWLKLSGAIINLIAAITDSPAASSGETLIEKLTEQLNKFADFIRDNPDKVKKFFDDAVESIINLSKVLGRLTEALVLAFSSEEFTAFVQLISEVVIPGLLLLIGFLGKVSQAILFLFKIPVVGDIIKWSLAFLVFEKGLNKLFPVTQKITEGIKKLVGAIFNMIRQQGVAGFFETIRLRATAAKDAVVKLAQAMAENFKKGATAVAAGASRVKDGFLSMVTFARRAAIAIGTTLYAALRRLAIFMAGQLILALRLLRTNIRLLIASTGIGALIVAGLLLIENWDKVKKYAKILAEFLVDKFHAVVQWVKENWKKILIGLLLAPFLPAGLLILGILRFKDRILGIFTDVKDGIINRFKQAIAWIKDKVGDLGNWVTNKLKSIPLVGRFFGGEDKEKPKVIQLTVEDKTKAEGIPTKRATGGVIPGHGVLDNVPALLTPGEWVLNRDQQERLATVLGISMQQVRAMIFGTNSNRPPRTGTFGAGRGPGGQRASLRPKTNLPAGLSRGTPRKVINYADFNLVSQTDPDGVEIWFLELANGTFGQVTSRDAARIQSSRGTWMPGYAKRSAAGVAQNIKSIDVTGMKNKFSMGGIVSPYAVQRFAEGGVVQSAGHGNTSSQKNITQNFEVKTQGETDWGYVMRLGAIHAQESF